MRDWRIHTLTPVTSFGRDERCHVSFSSNSIIFSLCFIMLYNALLCFYYAFIMLSLCFHYAFIMLSLCFFRYEINKGFFFRRCHLFTYYFPNTRIPLSSRSKNLPNFHFHLPTFTTTYLINISNGHTQQHRPWHNRPRIVFVLGLCRVHG